MFGYGVSSIQFFVILYIFTAVFLLVQVESGRQKKDVRHLVVMDDDAVPVVVNKNNNRGNSHARTKSRNKQNSRKVKKRSKSSTSKQKYKNISVNEDSYEDSGSYEEKIMEKPKHKRQHEQLFIKNKKNKLKKEKSTKPPRQNIKWIPIDSEEIEIESDYINDKYKYFGPQIDITTSIPTSPTHSSDYLKPYYSSQGVPQYDYGDFRPAMSHYDERSNWKQIENDVVQSPISQASSHIENYQFSPKDAINIHFTETSARIAPSLTTTTTTTTRTPTPFSIIVNDDDVEQHPETLTNIELHKEGIKTRENLKETNSGRRKRKKIRRKVKMENRRTRDLN